AGGLRHFERDQHRGRRAPALVRRQQLRRGPGRRVGRQRAGVGERARGRPAGQALAPVADAGDGGGEPGHAAPPLPNTSEQLLPPKSNELFIAQAVGPWTWSKRICALQAGSGVALLSVPGSRPSRSAISANTDSTMPAAPRVCPVQPLVELACSESGNSAATARASIASLAGVEVPCRLR